MITHKIHIIKTNNKARELVVQDLKALGSGKFSKENLERLSKLSKVIGDEFLVKKKL